MQHLKRLIIVFTLGLFFILLSNWPIALAAAPQASNLFVVPRPLGLVPACTQSDPCRLSTAVNKANNGDTLYLAAGTYTSTADAVVAVTKSITVYGGWNGAASGPIVRDPAHFKSTLNGQGQRRGVYIDGTITPTLDGLFITQGSGSLGGGIYVQNASPVIRASHIYSNAANSAGGGIYLLNGAAAQLLSNQIYSNTSSEGGGVSVKDSAQVSLLNNQIYSNVALYGGGGGIDLQDSPLSTLFDNIVYNNAADEYGGGLYVHDSPTITLSNNRFYGNSVKEQTGGGIHVYHSSAVTLTDNEIYGNTSKLDGGGLHLSDSASVVVQHNRIYNNTTLNPYSSGGGIAIYTDFTVTVAHNQIYQNRAHTGGGLYLQGGITGTTLADNEVYSNTANSGGGINLTFSSHVRLVNNLVHSNRVISYAGGGLSLSSVDNAVLLNNVVLNNQLANDSGCGSGIRFYESNASLWHTTVADNTGGMGAAICLNYSPSSARLTNTIIANQTVGLWVSGGNTAELNGVLWSGNGLNFDGYGQINVTYAITGNPAFAADGYHLTACSAALNAGVVSDVMADIDGDTRPADGAYDLGADEFISSGTCHLTYLPLVLK